MQKVAQGHRGQAHRSSSFGRPCSSVRPWCNLRQADACSTASDASYLSKCMVLDMPNLCMKDTRSMCQDCRWIMQGQCHGCMIAASNTFPSTSKSRTTADGSSRLSKAPAKVCSHLRKHLEAATSHDCKTGNGKCSQMTLALAVPQIQARTIHARVACQQTLVFMYIRSLTGAAILTYFRFLETLENKSLMVQINF